MPLIIGAKSATATGYAVDNSCRFNGGDSPYFASDFSGTGSSSAAIATYSFWVKLSLEDDRATLISGKDDTSNYMKIRFADDGAGWYFGLYGVSPACDLKSTPIFRDPSAWYNVVMAFDTAQATDTNRIKVWVNGVQITLWSTATYLAQNDELFLTKSNDLEIGAYNNTEHFDGYMAEVVCIDGTALDETSFGEFDEDSPTIWKPKDVSGLTFGTKGYYLDFEDSAALGADVSGNSNDFTATNLDATDQATDTSTNNFATMNPLDNYYAEATFAEGNCKITSNGTSQAYVMSTLGMTTSNWYWESKIGSSGALGNYQFGIAASPSPSAGVGGRLMNASNSVAVDDNDGNVYANGSSTGVTVGAFALNDIVNYAYDCSNNAFYIGKNGTWLNSGDPTSGASKTGAFTPGTADIPYFPAYGDQNGTHGYMMEYNFGGCSAFAISSGNADDNGYGNFEYDVPTGYYSICTKNLAEFGG